MKKVYLVLTMLSALKNRTTGSYAYRIVSASWDKDGKEPIENDEILDTFGNVREYEDGLTLFDRAKLAKQGDTVKAVANIGQRDGNKYLNLADPKSLRRAEMLEERKDELTDSMELITHAEKFAIRRQMSETGLSVVLNNLSTSLFAGVDLKSVRTKKAATTIRDEEPVEKEEKKNPVEKKDEEPADGKDEKALKIEALEAELDGLDEKKDAKRIAEIEAELETLIS